MNSKVILVIPLMLFLLVPTTAFSQTDFGATSSATTSGFESFTETESTSLTSVESPPDDIVMTPPPDDTFIGDNTPFNEYTYPPQEPIEITTPVTGLVELPHGFETITYEKFQDGYTWEVDENGLLYNLWDEERIGSIPEPKPEYPQVTENYTIVQNGDDTFTYLSHDPYIADKHEWKPYIIGEDDQVVQIQTNGGTVVFDKVAGAVTIFNEYGVIVDSDSYTIRSALLDSDVWTNLDVNNSPVATVVEEDGDKVTVSFIRENTEGKFTSEYIIHSGNVKTTVYFTNYIYENNKFAFTQTLDLPDNIISVNGMDDIDLTNYVGVSFDRETLEANMDLVLKIKNIHYSSGLGFDNLWSVNVVTPTKVSLDYANVDELQTAIGETVELDPTYTLNQKTTSSPASTTSSYGNSQGDQLGCGGRIASGDQGYNITWNLRNYVGGWYTWNGCRTAIVGFDLASIPDTALVSDVKLKYDITWNNGYAPNLVINQITQSGQDGWGIWNNNVSQAVGSNPYTVYSTANYLKSWEMHLDANNLGTQPNGAGHQYAYNVSSAIGTNIQTDLGAQGNADVQAQLKHSTSVNGVADWFALGLPFSTMSNGATASNNWVSPSVQIPNTQDMGFDNVQLQVTYYSPPSSPANVTVTPNGGSVDLAWSASEIYSDYEVSTHADYNPVHVAGTAGYGGTPATCSGGSATATAPTLGQAGVIGTSMYFDGVCDTLNPFNPHANSSQGSDMTFAVWMKSDAGSTAMAEVPFGKVGAGFNYLILNGQWASPYGYANNSVTVNGLYSAADAFPPNVWNHYAFTIAADKTTHLYVNGVDIPLYSTYNSANYSASTLTTVGASNADDKYGWNIGSGYHTSTTLINYPYIGWMDDMIVWHDVLTPAEITAVYEGAWGHPYDIVGANTLEYYMPFDDSSFPLENYVVLNQPSKYDVTYSVNRNGSNINLNTQNLSVTDTTSSFNTPYVYSLQAYNNAGGASEWSVNYAITLTVEPPTNLSATLNIPNVDLSWTGGTGATGYKIETSTDGTAWTNVTANTGSTTTTYQHTAPVQNTTNYYKVTTLIGSDVSTANVATTALTNTNYRTYIDNASSTSCVATGTIYEDGSRGNGVPTQGSGNRYCESTSMEYDISGIPDSATIIEMDIDEIHNIWTSGWNPSCEYKANTTVQPSTGTGAQKYSATQTGTVYAYDPLCTTTAGTSYNVPLSAQANTDLQNQLSSDWFAISWTMDGFPVLSQTGSASPASVNSGSATLNVLHTAPASLAVGGTPDAPTGLTAIFNTTTADMDLAWSTPASDNGSAITGYKIEVSTDGTAWTDVTADTGSITTTYTDTNPTMGSFNFYKVSAINAYGQSSFVSNHTVDTASSSGNTIITFTGSSIFTPTSAYDIEYLVVAGGGAGGGSDDTPAGSGGGAGGLRTDTITSVTAEGFNVTVGTGGTGGTGNVRGTSGTDSTFGSITSSGGGGGCAFSDYTSFDGGSGGGVGWYCSGGSGNTPSTTPSQGNDGGVWASPDANYQAGVGGGGSGSAGYGVTANTQNGSNGGDGTTSSITGLTYAGGGAGGSGGGTSVVATGGTGGSGIGGDGGNTSTTGTDGTSGTNNTGSGGGGGAGFYPYTNGASTGGNGGSGIVVVKFVTSGSSYIFGDLGGDMAGIPADAPTITTAITNPNTAPLDIDISITNGASNGTGTITNYEIYRDSTLVATTGVVSSYTDTVPSGGGTFAYEVKTVTSHGTSALSSSVSQTTATPPPAPTSAPTLDIANPNPSPFDVTVSFAMPSSGGSAINSFEIFRSIDDLSFTSVGSTSQLIFYDTVPNAGTFYYKFASTNLVGNSGQSPSGSITTATVPDVPSVTLAINNPNPSPFDITVSFVAPSSDGGSAVTGYNLSSSPDDLTYTPVATNVTADQTITVANAGTWYFKSQAINNVGTGTFGTAVSVATPTVPDAPTVTLAINNPNTLPFDITATFVAPASDGGSALIDYDLQYSDDNITFAEISGGTNGSYTHTVATAGTHYFQATVRNNVGDSVTGVVANMDTPTVPDAPTVAVTINNPNTNPLDITSSFVAPADNGGSTITGYNLFVSDDDITYTQVQTNVTADQVTTVASAGTYYFKAQAINLVGTSLQGSASINVTPTVPSVPLNATSTISNIDTAPYTMIVSWDTPTSNGGSNLTGYDVYRKQGSASPIFITNTTALSIVDTVPSVLSTNFTYQIYSVNNVGQSATYVDTVVTTNNVPSAPALNFTTGTTSLSWNIPTSDATVTGYKVFRDSVLLTTVTTLTHTDWTLINFGQSYTYEVKAVSVLGDGVSSNSIVTMPETEITGMISSGITGKGAVIDWDAPAYYQGNLTYNVWYVTPAITTGTPTVSAGTTLNTYSNFAPQLDYNTSYTFGVTITSPLGNSGFSNLVTLTTNVDGSIVSSDPLTGGMGWFDIDSVSEASLDVIEFQRETQLVPPTPVAGTPQVLTDTLQVAYPSWWDNMTCNVDYKFAQKTEQYVEGTDMTSIPVATNADRQVIGFSFQDVDNEVVTIQCAPQQSSEGDEGSGVYVMTQNNLGTVGTIGAPNIPLVTMIAGFSNGSYGTDGDFGALNIVGLFAILISMVGFNRVSPIVGVILSASLIFALAWFGIITIPTVIIGTIALVIFLAWGANRQR